MQHSPIISIHAPQWGATMHWACNVLQYQNFNPRTPVGCDYLVGHLRFLLYISIHAPQWGATAVTPIVRRIRVISIHAPQWGATVLLTVPVTVWVFQSTHPSGVRPRTPHASSKPSKFQSTHPSGVRLIQFQTLGLAVANFNPRTPVGCDHAAAQSFALTQISIHAPQWGATSGRLAHRVGDRFQSTHPSGVRPAACEFLEVAIGISIHAPQWGATQQGGGVGDAGNISIHAPQWGATRKKVRSIYANSYFNPRTPVGCDLTLFYSFTAIGRFQSTHPSGVRPNTSLVTCVFCWIFQSTHPSGVRHVKNTVFSGS